MNDDEKKVRHRAMDLLARREYGRSELCKKLISKGFAPTSIEPVLVELEAENLLSETRFVESFVRSKMAHGYGPLHIAQALRQKGVESSALTAYLEEVDIDWSQLASEVRQKRFGTNLPQTPQAKAKQMRFLQYRGFTSDHIRAAFR